MRASLIAAILIGAGAASAQTVLRWSADTARPAPVDLPIYRGETVALEPSYISYGAAVSLADCSATLYYQTNGMLTAWWSLPAIVTSNSVRATFGPTNDCGAASYTFFISLAAPGGVSHRAMGTLSMRAAPGYPPYLVPFVPAELPEAYPPAASNPVSRAYTAPVVLRWLVDSARPASVDWPIYRGESVAIAPTIQDAAAAIAWPSGTAAALYYQTNGMGAAWWMIPAATSVVPGQVVANWHPSDDVGAAAYTFFVAITTPGAGTSYRALGRLLMREAPGSLPDVAAPPTALSDLLDSRYDAAGAAQAVSNALAAAIAGDASRLLQGDGTAWLDVAGGTTWLYRVGWYASNKTLRVTATDGGPTNGTRFITHNLPTIQWVADDDSQWSTCWRDTSWALDGSLDIPVDATLYGPADIATPEGDYAGGYTDQEDVYHALTCTLVAEYLPTLGTNIAFITTAEDVAALIAAGIATHATAPDPHGDRAAAAAALAATSTLERAYALAAIAQTSGVDRAWAASTIGATSGADRAWAASTIGASNAPLLARLDRTPTNAVAGMLIWDSGSNRYWRVACTNLRFYVWGSL